jgi:hypothetical protein
MNFIERLLARLFDGFKAKNPIIAGVIISVLIAAKYFLTENDLVGVDEEKILGWILFGLAALTGSRTTEVLKKEKPKE